jgi:probable HAF family extracellular repeat protein
MRIPFVLTFAVVCVGACPAPAQVMYTITDLGTLGGNSSIGLGINLSGRVVGYSYLLGNTAQHAFRTNPGGTLGDLGTLGGTNSFGEKINAAGQIVGLSDLANGVRHAFRTAPNGLISDLGTDLGNFPGGSQSGVVSGAYGINDAGQVVGFGTLGTRHAFRTTATSTLSDPGADLGTFSGGISSSATAINASGQVTGRSTIDSVPSHEHAFRTTATGLISDSGTDLGTLGGTSSSGFAINNAGQVVGESDISGNVFIHAFRTTPTGLVSDPGTDLGVLAPGHASYANGINNFGVVVGGDEDASGSSSSRAFIYDTMLRDLNDLIPLGSGWILQSGNGINDSGWITGSGLVGGQNHAFLLVPVPEPSSLIFGGVVLCAGLFARRRGRSKPVRWIGFPDR